MTDTKKGGRRPAAGTVGYQKAHRANVWAKARRAQSKWERLRINCILRTTADQVMVIGREFYRETITAWTASTLHDALGGGTGLPYLARIEDACQVLLQILCAGPPAERETPAAPQPERPGDRADWSYETSLREAGAVRLAALASISEVEQAIESGEVIRREQFDAEYTDRAVMLRSRIDTLAPRLVPLMGELSHEELLERALTELLEVLE